MKLAVIVPVHNGAKTLDRCLTALAASGRRPDEVIVVDDGSRDDSAARAEAHGVRVIRLVDGPCGPALARNRGAAATEADVLLFVDSDVVVHPATVGQVEQQFASSDVVDALFGSYDDEPTDPGVVSRYKNLLHHHTHQTGRPEATTFWAGCGAVRREAFEAVGGFAESYQGASIEDIEFGHRLVADGYRVRLCPEILSTHLKRWSLWGMVRTDVCNRAIPWSRLIATSESVPDDLNLGWESRIAAAAAWLFVLLAALMIALGHPVAGLGSLISATGVVVCHLGTFRLFLRTGGPLFCVGAFFLHVLYLMYSSAIFAAIVGPAIVQRNLLPVPAVVEQRPAA